MKTFVTSKLSILTVALVGAGALGASACAVAPADPSVDTTEQGASADEGAATSTAVAEPGDPFGISDGTSEKASVNTSGVYATAGRADQPTASVHPARPNTDSHVDFDDANDGAVEIHVNARYADGHACNDGSECESGLCQSGLCSSASGSDTSAGTDIGTPHPDGEGCGADFECESAFCSNFVCSEPTE